MCIVCERVANMILLHGIRRHEALASSRTSIDDIMESNRAIAETLIAAAEELWIPVVESRMIVCLNRTIDSFSDYWIHSHCRFLDKT